MATGSGRVYTAIQRAFRPVLDTRDLPSGICGRVTGVALVYGVRDAYGTTFAPGCLDRTKREKLAAGKVSLFADHAYGIHSHVGVVRTLSTVGNEEQLAADLFDTEEGRKAKEYLSAVMDSGGYTGFSIGFYDRSVPTMMDSMGDFADGEDPGAVFTEIELDEVSITPRPAVPGADVVGVRSEQEAAAWRMFETACAVLTLETVRARMSALEGNAQGADSADAGPTPVPEADAAPPDSPAPVAELATLEDRRAALALLYSLELTP
jgi:HK97 family phage prohead protease